MVKISDWCDLDTDPYVSVRTPSVRPVRAGRAKTVNPKSKIFSQVGVQDSRKTLVKDNTKLTCRYRVSRVKQMGTSHIIEPPHKPLSPIVT